MQTKSRPSLSPLLIGYLPLATFFIGQAVWERIDYVSYLTCAVALGCLLVVVLQKIPLNPILLAININFVAFPLVLESLFAIGQSDPAILYAVHTTEAMLFTVLVVFVALTVFARRGLFEDAHVTDKTARKMSWGLCVIVLGAFVALLLDRSQAFANTGAVVMGLIVIRAVMANRVAARGGASTDPVQS